MSCTSKIQLVVNTIPDKNRMTINTIPDNKRMIINIIPDMHSMIVCFDNNDLASGIGIWIIGSTFTVQ